METECKNDNACRGKCRILNEDITKDGNPSMIDAVKIYLRIIKMKTEIETIATEIKKTMGILMAANIFIVVLHLVLPHL